MKKSLFLSILLPLMLTVPLACGNGAGTETYQLTGHILEDSAGISDVTVHIMGDSLEQAVTTDSSGKYTVKRLRNGEYTVTPSKPDYAFDPSSAIITVQDNDVTLSISATNIVDKLDDIAFISIPAGTFRMGDIHGDGESDESPVHTVQISAFEMSSTEVTQKLYEGVMGTNPSRFERDNLPVERVTWQNAARFCNRLSESTGLEPCYDESTWSCDFSRNGYRLPTEAEWEYACRAGTETEYYTGDGWQNLDQAGWYAGNSSNTKIAGLKEPNAWGLYDMHGNVSEWCTDWYGAYESLPSTDPTGPASGDTRVFRGGNWGNAPRFCRSAYRNFGIPTGWIAGLGFRLVRRQ